MTLRHGRPLVVTPGPSVIPDRVLAAMARPMPNLYEGELVETSESVLADLPRVARTSGEVFGVVGNGHTAWQMVTSNVMRTDRTALVLASGTFARVWGAQARASGFDVEVLPEPDRSPVDPDAVEARLRDDAGHRIGTVLVVLADTATSVRNDVAAIRRAIDAAGHPALLCVDAIASLGCDPYEMDEWGVDVTVGASQKGLMTPPGLGIVWAGERALAEHEHADRRVGHLDWSTRIDVEAHYQRYDGTPPIPHIHALREALDLLFEEGLEQAWHRHEVHARAVWAAVDAWSADGGVECEIPDPAHRSHAVTTIRTGDVDADALRRICETEAGLTLGLGIGPPGTGRFRIGHMGHLNPPMLLGALGTVEAGLRALGAPLGGSGVAAAAEVIGVEMAASAAVREGDAEASPT